MISKIFKIETIKKHLVKQENYNKIKSFNKNIKNYTWI